MGYNKRKRHFLEITGFVILLLIAFVLGIKGFREPDLWWIIRTGEWIVQNGHVPHTDPFSYTFNGAPWINVKWGYEVLAYAVARLTGPECVYLIQSFVNVLLVLSMAGIFRSLQQQTTQDAARPMQPLSVLAWLLTLLGINFRMIGRPEMISHLMSLVFILIFLHHRKIAGKSIWILVPAMVLWTNLHEAYGTGLVIAVVMAGGAVMDAMLLEGKKRKWPWKTVLVSGCAIASISINPLGPKMIWHPFEIFRQVGANKFTTELYDWHTGYYWQQEEVWLMLAMAFVTLLILFRPGHSGSIWWKRPLERAGAGYCAMLLLFLYLGFTAHRNVPFFILSSAPLIALEAARLGQRLKKARRALISVPVLLVLCATYFFIVSGAFYRHFAPRDSFGLGVSGWNNPVGATNYIKEHPCRGNSFTDFLVSAYMMWHLRPDYKTFIDLRDLDVFPEDFFNDHNLMTADTNIFKKACDRWHFNYAVVFRPEFPVLHRYLYGSKSWQLVFADPVASIYVRHDSTAGVLNSEAEDVFHDPPAIRCGRFGAAVNKFFNPFYKAATYGADVDVIASGYYRDCGALDLSVKRAKEAITKNRNNTEAWVALGQALMASGDADTTSQGRLTAYKKAWDAFDNGIRSNPAKTGARLGQAMLLLRNGDYNGAISAAQWVLNREPENKEALILAAECHSRLSFSDRQNAAMHSNIWRQLLERAAKADPGDVQIRLQLGFFYCSQNNCEKARQWLEGPALPPGISKQDIKTLRDCKNRCGIK